MSKIIVIIVAVFILVGGWFYWFQLRPSQIRQSCQKQATDRSSGDCRNVTTGRENGGYESCVAKLGGYDSCLHDKGLK